MTDKPPPDHANVIAFPPLIAVVFAFLGAIAFRFWPRPVAHPTIAHALAIVTAAGSISLALWASRQLRRAGTTIDPHGSSTAIVTTGPYAFSRNPLYVAVGLLLTSLGLGVNSLAILLTLIPWLLLMHFGVVLREERYLTAKFGTTYTSYQQRVRRWL